MSRYKCAYCSMGNMDEEQMRFHVCEPAAAPSEPKKPDAAPGDVANQRAAWLAAWIVDKWNGTDDLPGWVRKSAQCWADLQNENALLREQIHCLESAVEYWRAGREASPD